MAKMIGKGGKEEASNRRWGWGQAAARSAAACLSPASHSMECVVYRWGGHEIEGGQTERRI
eukprot:357674-Chlamydomonas_euryale.AAC.2